MSIETFLRILLRNWWLVVLSVVITAGSSAVFVYMQQPIYRASTTVELRPSLTLENPNEVLNTINALTRRNTINTIARKATSTAMMQQVADALGVPVSAIQGARLAAIVIPDTNLIEVRAESTSPEFAASVANTVAQKMLGQTLEKVIQMEVIDVALPPTGQIEPQPQRVITLGLFFGLILGLMFAVLEHVIQQMREKGSWPTADIFSRTALAAADDDKK
jgi:capsular polysaccharide biosynthesis protein